MSSAVIADIKRGSFEDGSGIRTVIFFKGCPLNCRWCHNPECISPKPQTLFYPEKCIGCQRCSQGCYAGARTVCGSRMTAEQIMDIINQDKNYYGETGGVTFSGGEPVAQAAFLKELIELCRGQGINTAIETSLFIYDEEIFKKLNFIMADLKIWNDSLHQQYTGVSNQIILENFKKLDRIKVPIIARTPVIPEIEQDIPRISEFLSERKNVVKYELLPYHPLGEVKRRALNMEPNHFSVPGKELMDSLQKYTFRRI